VQAVEEAAGAQAGEVPEISTIRIGRCPAKLQPKTEELMRQSSTFFLYFFVVV